MSSTAVMARRSAAEVETDSPQEALFRTLDFYPTPPWAARAGVEILLELDPEAESIWEPACGAGHMAAAAAETLSVFASDVYSHGFGATIDFLDGDAAIPVGKADWIFTNPPFKVADQFLTLGLQRARRGVALLLRLQFLEGTERFQHLHGDHPLTLCAPFAERVPMTLGRWDPEASSATAYAWFFWMKDAHPQPIRGIAPGTKRRLHRPNDAARFGWSAEAGLLEMMGAAA